jgi:hypothetical protein
MSTNKKKAAKRASPSDKKRRTTAPKKRARKRKLSADQYLADPQKALRWARTEGLVEIIGSNGEHIMTLSVSSDLGQTWS